MDKLIEGHKLEIICHEDKAACQKLHIFHFVHHLSLLEVCIFSHRDLWVPVKNSLHRS